MFLLLPEQCSVADNHSSRSASAVLCRSQPFQLFSEHSLAVLPDGKDFFVGLFYNLTVIVCERVFRGPQEMFLQCCSWFRSSRQLLPAVPAVPRAFSDCSSL